MDSINWLTLADYSAKHKVSVSTLRRRIKKDKVEFAFEGGKYYLPDLELKAISKAKKSFSPAPPKQEQASSHLEIGQHFSGKDFLESFMDQQDDDSSNEPNNDMRSHFDMSFTDNSNQANSFTSNNQNEEEQEASSSTKEALEHMTKELKKAYSAILQEKEEQLILLKEQVADLKTLVNILEEENQRMREGDEANDEPVIAPHVIREKAQL